MAAASSHTATCNRREFPETALPCPPWPDTAPCTVASAFSGVRSWQAAPRSAGQPAPVMAPTMIGRRWRSQRQPATKRRCVLFHEVSLPWLHVSLPPFPALHRRFYLAQPWKLGSPSGHVDQHGGTMFRYGHVHPATSGTGRNASLLARGDCFALFRCAFAAGGPSTR